MTARRILITLVAGIFAATAFLPASAAAQTLTAGVKGGVNVANVKLDTTDDITTSRVFGPIVGAYFGMDKDDRGGLLVEFFYTRKGAKASFLEDSLEITDTLRVDYIEIPIVGRVTAKGDRMMAHFFAGPAFAFKIRQTEKFEVDGDEVDLGEEGETSLRRRDISLAFGATLEIQRMLIEARYTLGLVNVAEDGDSDQAKSRTFSVLFGYRFK